jgi:hypothetical protein
MKKKLFFAGMLVCVLAFGMAVAGCGGDDDPPNTDPKTIVITGLGSKSGEVVITVGSGYDETAEYALGHGEISNGSVELPLYEFSLSIEDPVSFTGNGSYYLTFTIGEEEAYVFTDGKTLAELGISSEATEADQAKLPKYSFKAATSTIAFAKFVPAPTGQ